MNYPVSRAQLKGLQEEEIKRREEDAIYNAILSISATVINTAKNGNTQYRHDHWGASNIGCQRIRTIPSTPQDIDKIIIGLKKNFPDCDIRYDLITTKGGSRFILTVDWS
jgi:hypothetical protein